MVELPSSEEIVSHRVKGATYEAIALLYEIPAHRIRAYCKRAVKLGAVTAEQIGWKRQPREPVIPQEDYDEHWMKRVLSNVKQDANGCWIWQLSRHPKGYGQTGYRCRTVRVHRTMYEIMVGRKLTPDEFICHTCDVRACCNPTHLFLGDNDENMADKTRKGRHHAQQVTHCPRGHAYDDENTYRTGPQKARPNGARNCKACARIRNRLKAGWPQHLAETLEVTKPGHRPVNAKFPRKRKAA